MERKNKRNRRLAIILITFLVGTIIPFVDYLVIVEVFYLLIPFTILLLASLAHLIGLLFRKRQNNNNGLFLACIVPTLIGSQIIATYTVDKIQRFRSEQLIKEMESTRETTGKISADHSITFGIEIVNVKHSDKFRISYSKGFMTAEVYDSSVKSWRSVGWND